MKHGTVVKYKSGCRCDNCRDAESKRKYMSRYRKSSKGADKLRRHQARFYRRSQLAVEWMKLNRPDVWEQIAAQAQSEVESAKKGSWRVKAGKK